MPDSSRGSVCDYFEMYYNAKPLLRRFCLLPLLPCHLSLPRKHIVVRVILDEAA